MPKDTVVHYKQGTENLNEQETNKEESQSPVFNTASKIPDRRERYRLQARIHQARYTITFVFCNSRSILHPNDDFTNLIIFCANRPGQNVVCKYNCMCVSDFCLRRVDAVSERASEVPSILARGLDVSSLEGTPLILSPELPTTAGRERYRNTLSHTVKKVK